MIVADSNLLAYLLLPGPKAALAEQVFLKDPDWYSPVLWKSEFRNILFAYMRSQGMPLHIAEGHWNNALTLLGGRTSDVDPSNILVKASATPLTAYDAEYVVLAEELGLQLVTSDRQILRHASHVALKPEDFIRV